MARIWTTGFELGNAATEMTVGSASINSTTPYSGQYFLRHGSNGGYWNKLLPGSYSEFYYRVRFRQAGNNQNNTYPVRWYCNGTLLGSIRMIGSNLLWAEVGTTAVATSTIALANNTWNLLELYVKIADSGGRIQLRINGLESGIDYTGDTKPGADTAVNLLSHYSADQYGHANDFDDIAFNDTTGGVDDSWPGDGRIIALMPNGAGTYTDFTPNTGANYAAVDERGSDGDTTYVYESVTDQKDSYNMAACGLPAATTVVKRIWTEITAKASLTGVKLATLMRSNGHEHIGTDQPVGINYGRYVGADEPLEINGGAAWTPTDLDAIEAGIVVRTP